MVVVIAGLDENMAAAAAEEGYRCGLASLKEAVFARLLHMCLVIAADDYTVGNMLAWIVRTARLQRCTRSCCGLVTMV